MSYVAVVSGEVLYDGELEAITAGVTYVEDGHELVRRFPHMFKKEAGMRQPGRTIRTGSARRRPSVGTHGQVVDDDLHAELEMRRRIISADIEKELAKRRRIIQAGRERVPLPPAEVDLLAGRTPRYEVTLPSSVVSGIEREIGVVRGTLGDVEAGGYLLGDRGAIVLQVEAGPNSTHGRNSATLVRTWAEETVARHPHLRIVGNWHTHPSDRSGVPSSTDLQAFSAATTRTTPWLSLIATKGELGFMTPELHAWVTSLDGDTFVCEPASIVEP